jgi:hypothetical protein
LGKRNRNQLGLRIKDKYIAQKARELGKEMGHCIYSTSSLKATTGWVENFKKRYRSSHLIQSNADDLCRDFHHRVQARIDSLGIKSKNVFNMDQVPDTSKDSGRLRSPVRRAKCADGQGKDSNSQERFTATFTISIEGKMYKLHLLFSKLKKNPKVHKEVLVAVNETGMWSTDILENYVEEILLKRPQTSLLKEPVLLIIDSYGVHINLAKTSRSVQI